MKKVYYLFCCLCGALFIAASASAHEAVKTHYDGILDFRVTNYYKSRTDGNPGRLMILEYHGPDRNKQAKLEVNAKNITEYYPLDLSANSIPIVLPNGLGVNTTDTIMVRLLVGKRQLQQLVVVPQMRYWTVYIYPHSHVDIGYTNTQDNVAFIHKRNLDVAMELAEKTKDYPEGARFKWNPEVTWPIERYLHSNLEEKNRRLLDAIRKGAINVDASYVNTNTSACNDEELYHLYSYGKELEKLTGKKVKTIVQVDIPGVSWGVVPVANQLGISYFLSLYNGGDRTGLAHLVDFKPFWWKGPDGRSKVLFLQPGSYGPGAWIKGKDFWPLMAGQTDSTKLLRVVKTDNPRKNFVDVYLDGILPELEKAKDYPYNIFPMSWCMADNTPLDADLPDGVKSWNEEYAYPRMVICSATEMMEAFANKYGDIIPTRSGDFTEYWTDGLGSAAAYTGQAREVKERLIQVESLRSMLHDNNIIDNAFNDKINEAWRNVIMGTEHTWAYMAPDKKPISDDILKVKFGYFDRAKVMTDSLMQAIVSDASRAGSRTRAVVNTDSWECSSLVRLPAEESVGINSVYDDMEKEVLSQRLSTGELIFFASHVPALGMRKYVLSEKKSTLRNNGMKVTSAEINNGLAKLCIDSHTGDITSYIYKGTNFVNNKALLGLNSFRYLHGSQPTGLSTRAYNIKVKVKECGPLLCSLLITSDAEGCNSLSREIALTYGSPKVDIVNIVDKIAIKQKEGIHFGFAFSVPDATVRANVPWGVLELEKDQIDAANRNWISFERWLDISNKELGVTWCSQNACMFENGDMTANVIGSAVKSPEWITKLTPSAIIYSWALNNHWHTNFPLSQSGKISFRYSILPHLSTYRAEEANRFGIESCRPLLSFAVSNDFQLDNPISLSGSDNVFVTIYKTVSEKTSIMRFSSLSDKEENISLSWRDHQPKLSYCSTGETGDVAIQGKMVTIPAKGSVTIRIEW